MLETKNNLALEPVDVNLKVSFTIETIVVLVFVSLVILSYGVIKVKKG